MAQRESKTWALGKVLARGGGAWYKSVSPEVDRWDVLSYKNLPQDHLRDQTYIVQTTTGGLSEVSKHTEVPGHWGVLHHFVIQVRVYCSLVDSN